MIPRYQAFFWVEGFGSNPAQITERIQLPPTRTRIRSAPLFLSTGAVEKTHQFKPDYTFSTWELECSYGDALYQDNYEASVKTLIRRQRHALEQLNLKRHAAGLGPQALRIPMEAEPAYHPEVQLDVLLGMLEIKRDAVQAVALEFQAGVTLIQLDPQSDSNPQFFLPLKLMERLTRLGLQLHLKQGAGEENPEDRVVS